jgi:hypothetical protein
MLFGSLLIDLFAPTAGTYISIHLFAALALTYFGVLVNGKQRYTENKNNG